MENQVQMSPSSPSHHEELTPLSHLVWSHKWIFLGVTALVVGSGIAYTYFVTPVWEAKATIIFPTKTQSLLGPTNFGADQASLAATLTGGPTPLKVFGGMLESQRTLDAISEKTGLSPRKVRDMRSISDQAMESSITITARSKDAELAKNVVNLHLESLDAINKELNGPVYSNDMDAIGKQLEAQKAKVKQTEEELLKFQNQAVTAPNVTQAGSGRDSTILASPPKWDEQLRSLEVDLSRVKSSLSSAQRRARRVARRGAESPLNAPNVTRWRERLIDMQYDLQVKSLTLPPTSPEIVNLQKSIDITKAQMQTEIGRYVGAVNGELVDPTSSDGVPSLLTARVALEAQIAAVKKLVEKAPAESIELGRYMRELSSESMTLQQLQSQYDLAQLQAARDPSRWEVLDAPQVEDEPVNKSYGKNGALSLALGLLLGSLAALWRSSFKNRRLRGLTVTDRAVAEAHDSKVHAA